MKIHLQRELEELKKQLFHLASLVEENLKLALLAVRESDFDLARQVNEGDHEIDRLEVQVEEDCLKILALHQPVAVDLRYLIAVLKMNNDLERIGDLATNIAGGKSCTGGEPMPTAFMEKLQGLGEHSRAMLRKALESLMDLDVVRAREVLDEDDEADDAYRELVGMIRTEMTSRTDETGKMICWLLVAKNLERVADLATNIAEDTIYTVEGNIVRHGGHERDRD